MTVFIRKATISGVVKYFAELRHTNVNFPFDYVLCTDFMTIDLADDIKLYVRHKSGLFDLEMGAAS